MLDDEAGTLVVDRRVDDRFQRCELAWVGQHPLREQVAVDRTVAGCARKPPLDPLDQHAAGALQRAHHRVGVEHRDAGALEHRRDRRLAHADRPGEREAHHGSITRCSRSAPSSGSSGIPRMVK